MSTSLSWACVSAITIAFAPSAFGQSRWITVNGQRLTDHQAAQYDRLQCARIPDGHYWLNHRTGEWGHAGDPRSRGVLGELCVAPVGGGNLDGTFGPFATLGRAEQEANRHRAQGRRAVAFHNGDGYYVRVSR